ncbi:MAG: MoaD/ThiS family protein [Candidatus Freyarchaeota archaeon]
MSDGASKSGLFRFVNRRDVTVKQLLEELGLGEGHFVVFVDGKRVNLDSHVDEGSFVIVLPRIAGG